MNRLKEERKLLKKSQTAIADMVNISQQAYANYENEISQPTKEMMQNLSKIFNKSVSYLFCLDENKDEVKTRIPVLGSIPAGVPIEMVEDIVDYEDISPEMLVGDKKYFALKVKGDSMSPKFLDGDVVIVKKQADCDSGEFCIVAVNGDDATFKKVLKKENGIILQPLNSNYEPLIFDQEQIEKLPVRVLGKVVEIRRSVF